MPSSSSVRMTRMAISPRFATRTLANMGAGRLPGARSAAAVLICCPRGPLGGWLLGLPDSAGRARGLAAATAAISPDQGRIHSGHHPGAGGVAGRLFDQDEAARRAVALVWIGGDRLPQAKAHTAQVVQGELVGVG